LKRPLVTVITPTYNRAGFLDETIKSVLEQDYSPVEYIVIDDGSTDNTPEVMKKYEGKLTCIRHENMGETRTVNKGFSLARGEFVCVVNSDDPLLPGAISATVEALVNQQDALVAYPDWLEIDEKSAPVGEKRLKPYDIYNMLVEYNIGLGPGTLIRKSAIARFGPRDESFRYAGDAEFWMRMALNGRLVHIPRTLATHRTHGDSASVSAKGSLMASEVVRMARKTLSSPRLPYQLLKIRPQIMSNVYVDAIFYSRKWSPRMVYYRIISALLNPYKAWVLIKKGLQRVIRIFKRHARNFHFFMRGALFSLLSWLVYFLSFAWISPGGKEKKFAVVSSYLPPLWSGGAVVLGRILEGIDPDDYILVSRCNFFGSEGKAEFINKLPARYHIIQGEMRLPGGVSRPERWKHMAVALYRGCRIATRLHREKCGAVVATTDLLETLAAYFAARAAGVPFYLYVFDDYVYQWWSSPAAKALAEKLEPFMMANTQGVIVPNEFMAAEMFRRHRVYSHIVRNPRMAGSVSSRDLPFPADGMEIKIVFTGAVYQLNFSAFRSIIAAMELLEPVNIRLHLYTAQPRELLEANGLRGDKVEYHFHVPPREAAQAQEKADILVLPFTFDSRAAHFVSTSATGKLADYLAGGRPIVALTPDDAWLAWYLNRYQCGLSVPSEDPSQIAKALERIIKDEALRSMMRMNALERARADFDPVKARESFLGALEAGN